VPHAKHTGPLGRVALLVVAAGCSLEEFVGVRPSDAGAGPEAGTDAGSGADGVSDGIASHPCTQTFCDDFDDGSLGARWDTPPPAGSGLSLDSANWESPPRSLVVQCGMNRPCGLVKTLSGASHVRLDLDVRLGTPPEGALSLFRLKPVGGDTYVEIEFRTGTGSADIQICETSGCFTTKTIGALTTTRFRHITVDANLRGGGVSVALDGSTVLSEIGPIPAQATTGVVAELGDAVVSPGPSTVFRFDNIALDVL
jgi:hypothetical protein